MNASEPTTAGARAAGARAAGGTPDVALSLLVGLVVAFLGWCGSGVQVGADARYTTVVAESILQYRDARLTRYFPPLPPSYHVVRLPDGEVVSLYPLGPPLFVVPLAAVTRALGLPVVGPGGEVDLVRDNRLQPVWATSLMALAAMVIHGAALRRGAGRWSAVVVAMIAILGSPMFSIGARAMWADTIGAFLLTVALALLWRMAEEGRTRTSACLLASGVGVLLAAAGFTKPPFALSAVALGGLVLWGDFSSRRGWHRSVAMAVGGAVTMALAAWAVRVFLPVSVQPYYALASQLSLAGVPAALAGILLNPSRGLIWYCPWVVPLGFLLLVRARRLPHPARVVALAAAVLAQVALLASWHTWWGGYGYGPRLLMGAMPLFAFLAIELLAAEGRSGRSRATTVALLLTGLLAIAIHGRSVLDDRTWAWNSLMDSDRSLLHDWRYPQMLAGWIAPPLPSSMPPLGGSAVAVDHGAHPAMFRRGWSVWEGAHRWSEGHVAPVPLGRLPEGARAIRLKAAPFLAPDHGVAAQSVIVRWNGREIGRGRHDAMIDAAYELPPDDRTRDLNVLEFELPDAVRPLDLGLSPDPRRIGIALLELHVEPHVEFPAAGGAE